MAWDKHAELYEQEVIADQHARDEEIKKAALRKKQNPDCYRPGCGRPRSEHHHEPPYVITKIYNREPCEGFVFPPASPGV